MIMTTHDPNHALQFPGRVVMMKPGGAIVTGLAAEVVTEAELSATYGIDIGLFSVPRRTGTGQLTLCSPW
jgi:iron complex transport system ATP-binding protein